MMDMATPRPSSEVSALFTLQPDELARLKKRREDVKDYEPPRWTSNHVDPVSGQPIQTLMVEHANIVFIGPVGSGKSSLIGSLYRAVNEEDRFPDRIQLTLNHPDSDTHGTMCWMETQGNRKGTIVYQDTRGDQQYDTQEQSIHEFSLRGMYRDGASLQGSHFFSPDWWMSRRFFWERTLNEVPHCVAFVFDGSSDPFLDAESLDFFKEVFQNCTRLGYEPIIVITCLDLIYQEAIRHGDNYEVELRHKQDRVLQAFEDLNLTRSSIYFVTNFHEGKRGVKMWDNRDRGFQKTSKMLVDLARELLTVANRFIERKYTRNSSCVLL